jgi:cyclic pyranopterin phosphate synthase
MRQADVEAATRACSMADLTHLDHNGKARMVDVGGKQATARRAIAQGRIRMSAQALSAIRDGDVPKGDVLAAARIAGSWPPRRSAI